jgi:hypothetical protein
MQLLWFHLIGMTRIGRIGRSENLGCYEVWEVREAVNFGKLGSSKIVRGQGGRQIWEVGEVEKFGRVGRSGVPAVHFALSSDTSCKSRNNQRQKQVGENFSGNQPDPLTLWLHRASLNSTPHRGEIQWRAALPSVFWAATPTADFNYMSHDYRSQPPASNKFWFKLLIRQVVYL